VATSKKRGAQYSNGGHRSCGAVLIHSCGGQVRGHVSYGCPEKLTWRFEKQPQLQGYFVVPTGGQPPAPLAFSSGLGSAEVADTDPARRAGHTHTQARSGGGCIWGLRVPSRASERDAALSRLLSPSPHAKCSMRASQRKCALRLTEKV
jgi:hypothetical protein